MKIQKPGKVVKTLYIMIAGSMAQNKGIYRDSLKKDCPLPV